MPAESCAQCGGDSHHWKPDGTLVFNRLADFDVALVCRADGQFRARLTIRPKGGSTAAMDMMFHDLSKLVQEAAVVLAEMRRSTWCYFDPTPDRAGTYHIARPSEKVTIKPLCGISGLDPESTWLVRAAPPEHHAVCGACYRAKVKLEAGA